MAPKVAGKKGEKKAGKARPPLMERRREGKEKGKLCYLHLQGVEASSP